MSLKFEFDTAVDVYNMRLGLQARHVCEATKSRISVGARGNRNLLSRHAGKTEAKSAYIIMKVQARMTEARYGGMCACEAVGEIRGQAQRERGDSGILRQSSLIPQPFHLQELV